MIYKGIEIHNARHLIHQPDGVTWYRVPENVYQALESDMGKWMTTTAIGVELRFVMKSDYVRIRMQSLSSPSVLTTFHVFYGGIQGGWECHEMDKFIPTVPTDFIIRKPTNLDMIKKISQHAQRDFDPEVIRIIFERGEIKIIDIEGEVQPPTKDQTPQRKLLTYGSSITHGSNSLSISNAWPSLLAYHLNMDCFNLGLAGSCMMEPEMIDFIAGEGERGHWDIAILELGINVLEWDEAKIRERVSNTILQVATRNPSKAVYLISPFYCNDDFNHVGHADKWRRLMETIVNELALPNVTLFNGLDLLGDMSLISADEVHPSIYGMQKIAENLIRKIESDLD